MVGETYHVFTRSIAGYIIFNDENEYKRVIDAVVYYQDAQPVLKFSKAYGAMGLDNPHKKRIPRSVQPEKLIEIIAYCVMPTHLHFVLRQEKERGISIFMNRLLNSYTRYFNIKHKRKGPLWEGRFKKVHVENDDQLMHLTRYVHLNPVTSRYVSKAEEWKASSYREYVYTDVRSKKICVGDRLLDISPQLYRKFVEDQVNYQRQLRTIKDLLFD